MELPEKEFRCSICGNSFEKLSFEHIPPRSAFNAQRVETFGLEHWLGRSEEGKMTGGQYQQRGAGRSSLCEDCNNKTGAWYVPEYSAWAVRGIKILQQLTPMADADSEVDRKAARITLVDVAPLRFMKQCITMIMASNGPRFTDAQPMLRSFILGKHSQDLPDKYRLYLVLYRGPLARSSGVSGKLDTVTGEVHVISEVAWPPFSAILSMDEKTPLMPLGDITHFKSYSFDTRVDIDLELEVGFGHTPLPIDFRSRAAIAVDAAENDAMGQAWRCGPAL